MAHKRISYPAQQNAPNREENLARRAWQGLQGFSAKEANPPLVPPCDDNGVVAETITRKKKSIAGPPSQKPSRLVSCARSMPSPAALQNSQMYPLSWWGGRSPMLRQN